MFQSEFGLGTGYQALFCPLEILRRSFFHSVQGTTISEEKWLLKTLGTPKVPIFEKKWVRLRHRYQALFCPLEILRRGFFHSVQGTTVSEEKWILKTLGTPKVPIFEKKWVRLRHSYQALFCPLEILRRVFFHSVQGTTISEEKWLLKTLGTPKVPIFEKKWVRLRHMFQALFCPLEILRRVFFS